MACISLGSFALAACSATPTALPSGDLGIALSAPPSITLTQGDHTSVDVTVTRSGGFSGTVTLAVAGLPASVTLDIPTNPVAGNSATVGINVGDLATPGDYALTLSATGSGVVQRTLPLTLRVAQRNAVTVGVPYCNGFEPAWVAFQDGDGAWTRALPSVTGGITSFQGHFSTTRGGLAVLTRPGSLTVLNVRFGTPAEIAAAGDTSARTCGPAVSKTLLGTVVGINTDEFALITSEIPARVFVHPDHGNDFALKGLAAGLQDVAVTRHSPGTASAVTGVILRRSIDLPDSATLPVFDFATAEAFAPPAATVTVSGVGPEGATTATRLLTSHDDIPVGVPATLADPARPYYALPENQLLPADLQILYANANPTTDGSIRTAALYFRAPIDRTLALGASLAAPALTTVATAPALRLRAQFVSQSDYDRSAAITYQQGQTTVVSLTMTAMYATLAGTGYSLGIPDLSGVAGFNSAWALQPGTSLLWTAVGVGGTLATPPQDGAVQRTAQSTGTVGP